MLTMIQENPPPLVVSGRPTEDHVFVESMTVSDSGAITDFAVHLGDARNALENYALRNETYRDYRITSHRRRIEGTSNGMSWSADTITLVLWGIDVIGEGV